MRQFRLRTVFVGLATLFFSFMNVYGETISSPEICNRCTDESLYSDQAMGRFEWLQACHETLIVNYHDKIWTSQVNDPIAIKCGTVYNQWLKVYNPATQVFEDRKNPYYPVIGNKTTLLNDQNWFAKTSTWSTCDKLPVDYDIIGICNGGFEKTVNEAEENLTPEEARGRFYWLKECHPKFLLDYYKDNPNNPELTDPEILKHYEQVWLFDAQGNLLPYPSYPLLGLKYTGNEGLDNPALFYPGKNVASACRPISSGYKIVAIALTH